MLLQTVYGTLVNGCRIWKNCLAQLHGGKMYPGSFQDLWLDIKNWDHYQNVDSLHGGCNRGLPKRKPVFDSPKGIIWPSYCHEVCFWKRLGHDVLLCRLPRYNFSERREHLTIQLSYKHSFNTCTNLERIALTSLSHLLPPTRWLNCRFCNKSKNKTGANV